VVNTAPSGPRLNKFFFVCLRRTVREICCKLGLHLLFILYDFLDFSVSYVRCKTIALQAWIGPLGSRRLKLLEFIDSRHIKEARLSALHTGRLYPAGDIRAVRQPTTPPRIPRVTDVINMSEPTTTTTTTYYYYY
jgi:hypothetical protein